MREITAHDLTGMPERHRERIREWVRGHGLDPNEVRSIRVAGPLIVARVYVLNERGRPQLDPHNPDEAWTRTRWLFRRRPMPEVG